MQNLISFKPFFQKDNLLTTIWISGCGLGLLAFSHFLVYKNENIARDKVSLEDVSKALKVLLKDKYYELNSEVDNQVFQLAIQDDVDVKGKHIKEIDFYLRPHWDEEMTIQIYDNFLHCCKDKLFLNFIISFEKELLKVTKTLF